MSIPRGSKRMATGALIGAGASITGSAIRLSNKKTRKDALKNLARNMKVGTGAGAALGTVYHKVARKYDTEDSLDYDGSNLTEMGFMSNISNKISDFKANSQKLSNDLKTLSGWYEKLSTMSNKAASFIDKHPGLVSTLRWGVSRFSKKKK